MHFIAEKEQKPDLKLAEKEFSRQDILQYQEEVVNEYNEFFGSKQYESTEPVGIASAFDSTTKFVGSTISRFKPLFTEDRIPENGVTVVQPCLRAQNKQYLYEDETRLAYNTYFSIIGGIATFEKTDDVCADVVEYFSEKLGIGSDRISVKISSEDTDLLGSVQKIEDISIETDTHSPSYYRWKYGMPDVVGRGLTIAIRNEKTNSYDDIGNIIIMDEGEGQKPKAVQWGFGVETLTARMFNQETPIKASLVSQTFESATIAEEKFADTLTAVIEMMLEGVVPNNRTMGVELRDYIKGLSYLKRKIGMSDGQFTDQVKEYLLSKKVNILDVNAVVSKIDQHVKKQDVAIERFKHALRNLSKENTPEEILSKLSDENAWVKWSQKFGIHKSEVEKIIKSFFNLS